MLCSCSILPYNLQTEQFLVGNKLRERRLRVRLWHCEINRIKESNIGPSPSLPLRSISNFANPLCVFYSRVLLY